MGNQSRRVSTMLLLALIVLREFILAQVVPKIAQTALLAPKVRTVTSMDFDSNKKAPVCHARSAPSLPLEVQLAVPPVPLEPMASMMPIFLPPPVAFATRKPTLAWHVRMVSISLILDGPHASYVMPVLRASQR